MKKCLILILLVLVIVPIVMAIDECQGVMHPGEIPCMVISTWNITSCTTRTINIYNSNVTLIDTKTMGDYGLSGRCNVTWNHSTVDSYVLDWSSGDSSKVIIEGDDRMASLSVTLFIGALTFALFYLGAKHNFSKNQIANIIFKRCLIIGGMLLVSLDTAIILTIADNAGLGVARELFRYLWAINWTIYLLMLWLAWNTLINVLGLMQRMTKEKRMGTTFKE